jgi:hypothetical protein
VARRKLIASDVQAIIYRHAEDGEMYVHAFGPLADVEPTSHRDGSVTVRGLSDTTDVRAYANADGSVTLKHARGLPLTKEF